MAETRGSDAGISPTGRKATLIRAPVAGPIALDSKVSNLLTAELRDPLYTVHADYTYPDGSTTNAAIIAFFENYGIVGARTLAPKKAKGSLEYELKGQKTNIAGQRSTTLGQRSGRCIGLDRKKEVV